MSDSKRNKKYNNHKETKRTIILSKRDDNKDSDEKPSQHSSSSDSQPKILLKTKEKQPTPIQAPAISIASREGSVNSRVSSPIPKNVNVAANKDCKDLAAPVIVEQPIVQVPEMKKPMSIVTDHYQLNTQAFEYLIDTNTNFFVVGVIGQQGVGKSTFLNLLCSFDNLDSGEEYFNGTEPKSGVFETQNLNTLSAAPITEGIRMFVTKDRIILLDCSPVLCNPYKKDYVLNEIDDLKMTIFLMSICHLLIVVQEEFYNPNLIRLIQCAEMMKPNLDKEQQDEYFPNVLFVRNMATSKDFSTGTREEINRMYKCIYKQSKLKIFPGIGISPAEDESWEMKNSFGKNAVNLFIFPKVEKSKKCVTASYTGHPNINILIAEFRQRVFMSPRPQIQTLSVGLFSEKNWSHLATNVWESHKNNYFLRKYDNFKEKEWIGRPSVA